MPIKGRQTRQKTNTKKKKGRLYQGFVISVALPPPSYFSCASGLGINSGMLENQAGHKRHYIHSNGSISNLTALWFLLLTGPIWRPAPSDFAGWQLCRYTHSTHLTHTHTYIHTRTHYASLLLLLSSPPPVHTITRTPFSLVIAYREIQEPRLEPYP